MGQDAPPLFLDWKVRFANETYRLIEDPSTGALCQLHEHDFDSKLLFERACQQLSSRQHIQHKHLVLVIDWRHYNPDKYGCFSKEKLYVLIEHLPRRLSDVYELNQKQTAIVLVGMLEGFQRLLQLHDFHFPVNAAMVGLGDQGEVKVWMNQDFSAPAPAIPQSFFIKYKAERINSVIEQIFEIAAKHSANQTLPPSLVNALEPIRKPYRFETVLHAIHETSLLAERGPAPKAPKLKEIDEEKVGLKVFASPKLLN